MRCQIAAKTIDGSTVYPLPFLVIASQIGQSISAIGSAVRATLQDFVVGNPTDKVVAWNSKALSFASTAKRRRLRCDIAMEF